MKSIEFLKKANTVLIFVLLVAAIVIVGNVIYRFRKPTSTVHVAVDSLQLHKKQ